MVEKPDAKNRACENQGNQSELSDHWKLKKCFFKKITVDNAKKDKKIDWNTNFDKKFYWKSF